MRIDGDYIVGDDGKREPIVERGHLFYDDYGLCEKDYAEVEETYAVGESGTRVSRTNFCIPKKRRGIGEILKEIGRKYSSLYASLREGEIITISGVGKHNGDWRIKSVKLEELGAVSLDLERLEPAGRCDA